MDHWTNTADLLDRLRQQEADWMRTGRWYHLIVGLVTGGGYLCMFLWWQTLMDSFAGLFEGRDLREAAETVYWMGAAGVGFAVLGVFGGYSLQLAWRYWNGNDMRRGVIASLEARAPHEGVQRLDV